MDTEKCRALLTALELGSLTAAAESLKYTTSGVSRMMAGLEEEIGFPLLIRSHGGVLPTEDCQLLLPLFRDLVRDAEHCRQLADEIRGAATGSVTVGVSYSAFFAWLTQIIAGFKQEYPRIEVRLLEGSSSELYQALGQRRADFCLISRREGTHVWIPLLDDPLVAWVPQNHPLAGLKAFPVKAFASEPFIDTYPGRDTDNSRLFARLGVVPNTQFTSSDSAATYAIVEAGLGLSLNNSLTSRNWNGKVAILPLDPPQSVSIGVVYQREEQLSPAARKFVAYATARSRLPAVD